MRLVNYGLLSKNHPWRSMKEQEGHQDYRQPPRPKSHPAPLKGDGEGFKVKNYVRILDGNLGQNESSFLEVWFDHFDPNL
jgi:hypothetical protein